jgi:hypothetical protein
MGKWAFWTQDEVETAARLWEVTPGNKSEKCRAIAAALGRTSGSVVARYEARGPSFAREIIPRTPRTAAEIRAGDAPPEVIAEREEAMSAPRSLTAALFGDPPPSRSALSRYMPPGEPIYRPWSDAGAARD